MNVELMMKFIEFIKDKTFDDSNELKPVSDIEKNKGKWLSMTFENKKV